MEGKDITMLHSTVASKGQTTIPEKIRHDWHYQRLVQQDPRCKIGDSHT
jgi:hypothetical protein